MDTPLSTDGGMFRFVHDLAEEAGRILGDGAFRQHAAAHKQLRTDLVTDYDRRAEAYITTRLRSRFPSDLIVAEEESAGVIKAAARGQRRWLIDPLDGTTNFAHGLPFFCVSIAVEEDGIVQAGAIDAPALGWRFVAERGQGAWLWRRDPIAGVITPHRLHVSDATALEDALLVTGFPYDRGTSQRNNFDAFVLLQKTAQAVRRIGSAALDLALTASGQFDGYWEMKLKPWDLAAGTLMVEEAGGRVTGYDNLPMKLESGEAVATNGHIHDALVATLAKA